MLGLWALQVLIEDGLKLIFGGLRHLSTLISHFNILQSSLAVELGKVSIFCCFIRITSIGLLRSVLLQIPLINVLGAIVNRQDHTLALL
jgi:hypothetical protein